MAIKYMLANSDTNLASIQMIAEGDGIATSLVIDLSDSPFILDFKHNFPITLDSEIIVYFSGISDTTFSGTASLNRSILTITFNKPLPQGDGTFSTNGTGVSTIGVGFVYQSI